MESGPGSVSQVRASTTALAQVAKGEGIPIFLVGHVTKEGALAGPRVLEHMVDTVLTFEGDRHYFYRVLRAVKNRFGSTDEIGLFEMHEEGLVEVSNPSEMLLSERAGGVAGSAVTATVEGSRPLLVEVQALVAPSYLTNPRRTVAGVDTNRVNLILAVLEKRVGMSLANQDVFVNIAGGVRVDEPAADLAIAVVRGVQLPGGGQWTRGRCWPGRSDWPGKCAPSGRWRSVCARRHGWASRGRSSVGKTRRVCAASRNSMWSAWRASGRR